ncbi:MAG: FAD-dependent oxidoreductase [Deltaproteobacteria bacterium]
MPILAEPRDKTTEELPKRSARVAAETEVLVVGGGPAGIGAALGSAMAGAGTVLVERYGFLGGSPTVSLVDPIASFFTHSDIGILPPRFALFPKDHGKGFPVEAGILEDLVVKLIQSGGAQRPMQQNGYTVPFDPEKYKLACMDLLDEAGVSVLLHSQASGYLDGRMPGVVFETKSGPILIRAKRIVDCTGDGDVAVWAGAPYEVGRSSDGFTQPMTLLFRVMDFNRRRFKSYVNGHPGEWDGVRGLWELIRKAAAQKQFRLPREDMLFFGSVHPREVNVNSTRVTQVLGTNVWDLTKAEWDSRRQMQDIMQFLKEYVPGFEVSYVGQSGTGISVRETRRIMGDYVMNEKDVLEARKFDDAIAKGTYPVDEHNPTGRGTILKDIPYNDNYEIPLRCLLPKGLDTMTIGGRCISGTHIALSSYRVIPTSICTGQAAGACAALSAKKNVSVHAVDFRDVRSTLLDQGADL